MKYKIGAQNKFKEIRYVLMLYLENKIFDPDNFSSYIAISSKKYKQKCSQRFCFTAPHVCFRSRCLC